MKVCSICQRCYNDTVASCAESEHPELSEARKGSLQSVAGYSLEMMLESGIKGETYRARRIDSDQSCLIRILAGSDENKNQFLQDAKTAATIFNESIVDVYEAGPLERGEVFVVAEEPAGQSARELLNNVGVPQLLTTVQVVRQAAEAVHALHLSGLTHRALRPENIVLTTDAEHRLLVRIQNVDLGGIAEHSIVSNKFLIDSALDSLRYFAPEQFTGDGASAKTDVYSLGIVLYEMLAGTPPFDAEKASGLIDMHRNQRPPDVTIDNFDLRMLLTHSLMESLQKEPAKRQSSASAFARQLRHIEQLATHSPTPPPASVAPPAPLRANVAPRSMSAAAVKAAPIMQTTLVRQIDETQPVTAKAQPATVKLEPEPVAEPAPSFLVLDKIEANQDVHIEISSEHVDEVLDLTTEQPVEGATKPDPEPTPKSRLKRLKKQLRSFTTPVVAAQSAEPSTPRVVEGEREELGCAPARLAPRKIGPEQPEVRIPSQKDAPSLEETSELIATKETPKVSLAAAALVATAAAPALQKIECEQPDDDLPSLDDIPEALFNEPMPQESMVSSAPVIAPRTPIPSVPRKIEWIQPEDDISYLDDVSEALLTEQVSARQVVPEPEMASPSVLSSAAPRKIEWIQPEDDVPSLDDIPGALRSDPLTAAPVVPERQLVARQLPVSKIPRKIDWEQPEDDIPSMEAMLQVLSEEPMLETAFVAPAVEDIPPASPMVTPRKIEWIQRDDDIPSMEDAIEVLAKEDNTPISLVEPEPEVVSVASSSSEPLPNLDVIPAVEQEPTVTTANVVPFVEPKGEIRTANMVLAVELEPEEITLVSPPRRIQIEWEQPKPWETLSDEIEFFPTLLGDVDTKRKADAESERFFSDYYAEVEPRSFDHYRSLMIGSGFIVLIVLFFFGNDSVWKYIQGGSSADSIAVQTTSPKQTFPQSGQTTAPNEQRLLKNFEKVESDDDVESAPSKPSPIRVSASTSEGTVSAPADKSPGQKKEPQTKASQRSAGKTTLVPSTLVISSDDGKISSKVEPQKRKPAEPTRPRIVENPNP